MQIATSNLTTGRAMKRNLRAKQLSTVTSSRNKSNARSKYESVVMEYNRLPFITPNDSVTPQALDNSKNILIQL